MRKIRHNNYSPHHQLPILQGVKVRECCRKHQISGEFVEDLAYKVEDLAYKPYVHNVPPSLSHILSLPILQGVKVRECCVENADQKKTHVIKLSMLKDVDNDVLIHERKGVEFEIVALRGVFNINYQFNAEKIIQFHHNENYTIFYFPDRTCKLYLMGGELIDDTLCDTSHTGILVDT